MKGNVLDMAVGIIVGAAFGAIITSLVKDVIMPPIGLLLGGVDFSTFAFVLKQAQGGAPAVKRKWPRRPHPRRRTARNARCPSRSTPGVAGIAPPA